MKSRTVESFDSYTRAKDQHQDRDGPNSISNGVLCAWCASVLGGCADVLDMGVGSTLTHVRCWAAMRFVCAKGYLPVGLLAL